LLAAAQAPSSGVAAKEVFAMDFADYRRFARRAAPAVAVATLLTVPAVAFGGMGFGAFHGGFHGGGFHGAPRGVGFRPPPPAIDAHPLRPPLVAAPRPVPVRVGFVRVRPGDFFHLHDNFRHRDRFGRRDRGGFPWGWGGYGTYAVGGGGEPVYAPQAAAAAEPAPCPELLTWSPRLGRAIRQNLCDEAPRGVAWEERSVPRG
jgi:hypothetical protein